MTEKIQPFSPEWMRQINNRIGEHGWTARAAFIDNNPAKGLNGVRLMAVQRMIRNATSIQIFDTGAVTIEYGNTEAKLSLTGPDAAALLEWLRANQDEIGLSPEFFDALPTAETSPARAAMIGPEEQELSRLIEFLKAGWPEVFGPDPILDPPGGLYRRIETILRGELRSTALAASRIYAVERLAHGFYRAANEHMRRGGESKAAAALLAAQELRELGQAYRSAAEADSVAPPHFPEAIDAIGPADAEPFVEDLALVDQGDAVWVTNADHARYRQMGEVKGYGSRDGQPGRAYVFVQFPDGGEVPLYPSEFSLVATPRQTSAARKAAALLDLQAALEIIDTHLEACTVPLPAAAITALREMRARAEGLTL